MKLGLMVIPPLDIKSLARKVRRLRLEAIELALPISLEPLTREYRRHITELTGTVDVVFSFHQPLLNILSNTDAAMRRRVMDAMREQIDFVASLGGGIITVHSAITRTIRPRAKHWRNPATRWFVEVLDTKLTTDYDTTVEDTAAALAELGDFAAPRGVRLALENNFRDEVFFGARIDSFREVRDIVARVGRENVGLCLDVFKAYSTGEAFPESIAAAAGRLINVHISDISDTNNAWAPRRGAVGSGLVAWEGVFRALSELRYDGAFHLEMIREDHEQDSSCAFIRGILERLERRI